jgi:ribosome-associated protein
MEGTANSRECALEIGRFLSERKGEDTTVLDISRQCSWTRYFILTTITSQAHMRGIVRQLKEFLDEIGVTPRHRQRKVTDEGWYLLDCGDLVIHLMSRQMRDFYNLEHLWYSSESLFHSSKSS